MTARAVVVTSCDRKYLPLARGLALSLRACGLPSPDIDLAFLGFDLGASDAASLSALGMRVTEIPQARRWLEGMPALKSYNVAQMVRPYLPEVLAGYEAYLWLDGDTWVQEGRSVLLFIEGALAYRDRVVACPELDVSYGYMTESLSRSIDNLARLYGLYYGAQAGRRLADRPMVNSGAFAMAAANPIWAAWRSEVDTLYAGSYGADQDAALHMAEQLSLNRLIQERSALLPLPAANNYICSLQLPMRHPSTGKVCISYPPHEPIGIVHLSRFAEMRPHYLERGLMFDRGSYLTAEERAQLDGWQAA
ncbi:MAG: hypothetical protein JNL04_06545 [Rhodospirillaceae bacterium]|nr:hypothetical protein [Rhodospirillaceae bacterium]